MVAGMNRQDRVAALEQVGNEGAQSMHCLQRYEDETDEQAVAAYEAENGPIGEGRNVMRVFVSKPATRAPGSERGG